MYEYLLVCGVNIREVFGVVNCFSFAESRFKLSVHFKVLADELDFLLPQWLFTEISKICNFTRLRSNPILGRSKQGGVVNCFSFAESRFKLSVHFKVLADELDFLLPQWLFTEISKICNFTRLRSNGRKKKES
jgi:hypothetical protein